MSEALDWWPSPAKLNLFLHVCGRKENGYHELQTLFQLLDYGDKLAFELNNSQQVTLFNQIDGVNEENNLIIKAAKLLQAHAKLQNMGACIHIDKIIPMGGGLGGGSSNAATVLVALNHLWECNLSQEDLAKLGLQLGADVPLFINGHTAFAEGVGEKLFNTELETQYFLVATPNIHVSTAAIFQNPLLPRNTAKIDFSQYKFEKMKNDCEKLVCKQHPEVANLLNRLLHYAPSRMTGTGASVFAVFSNIIDAQKTQKELPNTLNSFVCKGLNYSPLLAKLRSSKTKATGC